MQGRWEAKRDFTAPPPLPQPFPNHYSYTDNYDHLLSAVRLLFLLSSNNFGQK